MNATMSVSTHSLERAYQFIKANQLQNAELVLDAVVRVEPQNIEAWKTYMWITRNQPGLDWLKERVLKARELSETNKSEIVNYYLYLTQQLNKRESFAQTNTPTRPNQKWEENDPRGTGVRFELLNVFDYPAQNAMLDPRRRPRRDTYNFVSDIAGGILKEASRHPIGKKVLDYVEQGIDQIKAVVKNPKESYAQFAKSPYFEKTQGVGLLILFILGARLSTSNNLSGYIILGVFIVASGWWLSRFLNRSAAPLSNQVRMYLHENENNLVVVKKVDADEKGSEKKKV